MKGLACIAFCLLAMAAVSQAQPPRTANRFIQKPHHDIMLKVGAFLKAEGFLDTKLFPDQMMRISYERGAFAKGAVQDFPHLATRLREWAAKWPPQNLEEAELDVLHHKYRFFTEGIARGLSIWLSEFAPEIRALGGDLKTLAEDVRASQRVLRAIAAPYRDEIRARGGVEPFVDVPSGHWAEDAIIEMRLADLLRGYPDGKFRG